MPIQNLISVVVDRMHAGMVGAYGNSWIHTRAIDRLACESFVFDQAFVDCPRLDRLYRAYWFGVPGRLRDTEMITGSLPALLNCAGMHTALVTDEREISALAGGADFAEHVVVETPAGIRTATDAARTQLARLFAGASEWVRTAREPFCLWVHARGMAGAWDAPLEMRNAYADEEDPEPPRFATVPDRRLSKDYDPDELLGIVHAYAGQISLLDECIASFSDALAHSPAAANTLWTLLAARGFPLGEHLHVGAGDESLYSELVQIPWVIRFPDGLGSLARSQALVQPADLPGTLLDWLGMDRAALGHGRAASLLPIVRGESDTLRDRLVLVSRRDRAIRTPAWFLRENENAPAELFAKPSDRWEVNEVSRLLPEVVNGLQAALSEADEAGEGASSEPLSELLVTELD